MASETYILPYSYMVFGKYLPYLHDHQVENQSQKIKLRRLKNIRREKICFFMVQQEQERLL